MFPRVENFSLDLKFDSDDFTPSPQKAFAALWPGQNGEPTGMLTTRKIVGFNPVTAVTASILFSAEGLFQINWYAANFPPEVWVEYYVIQWYRGLLQREPSWDEACGWGAYIRGTGGDWIGAANGFLTSPEFNSDPADNLWEQIGRMYQAFLGRWGSNIEVGDWVAYGLTVWNPIHTRSVTGRPSSGPTWRMAIR